MPVFLAAARPIFVGFAALALAGLAGCRTEDGSLRPVFGAVFGVEGATSIPFKEGKIPDRAVRPDDRVVGGAANNPGQCIFATPRGQRFRAPCPEGYSGL